MHTLISVILFLGLGLVAAAGDQTAKPVVSFSLVATNYSFSYQLAPRLSLRVERDVCGWEVGVFKTGGKDNLLYPKRTWHGAYPCQISAWSHSLQSFPDERIIPIRGYHSAVAIRLIGAVVSGKSGSERFVGGRLEIYWKHEN